MLKDVLALIVVIWTVWAMAYVTWSEHRANRRARSKDK